jgi:xanthine dehydrogenase accessory factor
MTAIWIEISATRGSAPRDAGTAMKVTPTATQGTIGGGALELPAIEKAREMLKKGETFFKESLPLGPNLGQCCGGAVTLHYSDMQRSVDQISLPQHLIGKNPSHPKHLWLWGAGHVGRAVVRACHPQNFKITWIDTASSRFPENVPSNVQAIPAKDLPLLATRAPSRAHHLIFTYSHDIDFALCAALLQRGSTEVGLIGSATKWARFSKRLRSIGLDPASITCPIGDKSLGKAPDQIAKGVVHTLLSQAELKATG